MVMMVAVAFVRVTGMIAMLALSMIMMRVIVAILFETLDKGGFSRLPWPLQENDGCVAQGCLHVRSDMPPLHG